MKSNDVVASNPQTAVREFRATIDTRFAGLRLDQFVVHTLPHFSRATIISSIKKGLILVNGEKKKSSYRLKIKEQIAGFIEQKEELHLLPESVEFTILYEDEWVIVISKPPGLVVHPAPGNPDKTLVNGLLFHSQALQKVGELTRPGIVHRLDKDTSGIMVVAKSEFMHRTLVDDFKNHKVAKVYLALVHGIMKKKSGRIVENIGRHPVNRQKMAVRQVGGKHAVSNYSVLEEFEGRFSLLEIAIETGRTHQIRVHMSYLGHPVVGDTIYGSGRDNRLFQRQMLHAFKLTFIHPEIGTVEKKAPLWPDFHNVLDQLGSQYIYKGLVS